MMRCRNHLLTMSLGKARVDLLDLAKKHPELEKKLQVTGEGPIGNKPDNPAYINLAFVGLAGHMGSIIGQGKVEQVISDADALNSFTMTAKGPS